MYTPREARFATRSEIVLIVKKAREEREEEERRKRWSEFSATKICQHFNQLVQIGEKATAERSEQGPCANKILFTFIALLIPMLSQSSHNIIQGSSGWDQDQETPLKRLWTPNNVVRDVMPIVWDYLTWRWQVGLKHCLCFVSLKNHIVDSTALYELPTGV